MKYNDNNNNLNTKYDHYLKNFNNDDNNLNSEEIELLWAHCIDNNAIINNATKTNSKYPKPLWALRNTL